MSQDTKTVSRAVGRRIAAARQSRRLSQQELAQRLGWPRDTIAHYEYGRRALRVERLASIAAALAIHPATLLIDDPRLALLVARLVTDTELHEQVQFFVTTLTDADEQRP
ncbi:MAG: helix-turn-helix domain-containing protein [Chloroflexota bacterium]|nr:helix-turn-helix domain-containing protein [Chloroflexota bacterium]PLS78691.1 MAG: hypothetical protein CYG59_17190 [Chloroflexota bacterium]